MTLASALSNTSSVMLHTDTQYLGREFTVTSNAAEKASLEALVYDLQNIFHRCKKEADRLTTAQEILATLESIVSKQYPLGEQSHFAKIKGLALSALSSDGQSDNKISRARYFQDKLCTILYAKKLMTAAGMHAHAGLYHGDRITEFLKVFKKGSSSSKITQFDYDPREDLSSSALAALLRISYLFNCECGPDERRPLTTEELLELKSYSEHEDVEIKKIANDFTLARKLHVATQIRDKEMGVIIELDRTGVAAKILDFNKKIEHFPIEPSESLSAYYPAFDKYVNFINTRDNLQPIVILSTYKSLYEEHLTQLPAVHFAYRYFYNELTEACSLIRNRVDATKCKKAYEGCEGNVLPSPDDFQSIIAVFTEPMLPVAVLEEKKEIASEEQPKSSNKSKNGKSKKKHSPPKPAPRPQQKSESQNVETTSTSSTTSSTSSSTSTPEKEKVVVKLQRDSLPFGKLVYDPRVSSWFTNPEDCLSLPSYASLNEETKKAAVYKHAFPSALDELLGTAYCVQETYQNTTHNRVDTLLSIPGEIEFMNGKKVRGLFQYCFGGKDKVCYHRYFKEMSISDLLKLDQYSQAFEEAEFPRLSSASTAPAKKNPDQELVFEPHLNTYAVTDKTKGLTFRVFRIRTLT